VRAAFGPRCFVGDSELAADVRRRVALAATRSTPLVLRGETGSGRALLARALHHQGQRRGAFHALDCSSLGAESLELELFGGRREDGESQPGLFERAGVGTVYLAEVALMPLAVQARVREALEEGKLCRVGETRTRKLRARVLAGTSRDLEAAAREGDFDAGLQRLLSVETIQVPPLRERVEDVLGVARAALAQHGARLGPVQISDDVQLLLQAYDWPGNLRELEGTIERACRNLEGDELTVDHLSRKLRDLHESLAQHDELPRPGVDNGTPLGTHVITPNVARRPQTEYGRLALAELGEPVSLETFEKQALLRALDETGGDKLAAARLLKIGKSTLYRKLKRYDIR
jgi:DNA-binding NtrC family response regulator